MYLEEVHGRVGVNSQTHLRELQRRHHRTDTIYVGDDPNGKCKTKKRTPPSLKVQERSQIEESQTKSLSAITRQNMTETVLAKGEQCIIWLGEAEVQVAP